MKQKIVFFDIDGTLFDRRNQLVRSAEVAIRKLQEKGIYVALATGRAPFTFPSLRQQLGIDTYISFNGSYVVLKNKLVEKKPLEATKLAQLTELAKRYDHPLVFLDEHSHYTNVRSHRGIEESLQQIDVKYPEYAPSFHLKNEVLQALLYCEKGEEEKYKEVSSFFEYVRWHPLSVDVLPKKSSKAAGISTLLNELRIDREDAYAFGDGLNDVEMLSYVGTGVAMGNGRKEAKQVADYVTKHVEEDGVMHGLKHIGLM